MTINGLATLFSRMNYLWPEQPVAEDKELARQWYQTLTAIEDDVMLEALPMLAQAVERRPSIAQLIQQAKIVAASRPLPLSLPEGKRMSPYTKAWMTLQRAWHEGRLDGALFLPLAARHAEYFGADKTASATAAMVAESEALQQQIRARREPAKETV